MLRERDAEAYHLRLQTMRVEWRLKRQLLAPKRLQFFSTDQQFGVVEVEYVRQHQSKQSHVMTELLSKVCAPEARRCAVM